MAIYEQHQIYIDTVHKFLMLEYIFELYPKLHLKTLRLISAKKQNNSCYKHYLNAFQFTSWDKDILNAIGITSRISLQG